MSKQAFDSQPAPVDVLRFYLDAGVDEIIGEGPIDRYVLSEKPDSARQRPSPGPNQIPNPNPSPSPAQRPSREPRPAKRSGRSVVPTAQPVTADTQSATEAAQAAKTLDDLKTALEAFEGCALKATAKSTVFADGNPEARLMVIGEAPGSDEDRQGLPFVGVSGKLLDRMLESIGYTRDTAYISNIIPWRPPGNRKPTPEEVGLCVPFIERHVELIQPKVILMVGGLSAKTFLNRSEGITRLRGRWEEVSLPGLEVPIPAMATFHPAYLLRSPQQKRLAWRDLLAVKEKLDSLL